MSELHALSGLHIVSVVAKQTLRGTLWRIRDDQGGRYSTENMCLASFCQRAYETKALVRIWSASGWFDRTLMHVDIEPESRGTVDAISGEERTS